MARKITTRTKLKKGDIVRYPYQEGRYHFVGIVVRQEKFLGKSGFIATNTTPGDRAFIRENGVDWYQRFHLTDLVHKRAEVITPIELVLMFSNAQDSLQQARSDR